MLQQSAQQMHRQRVYTESAKSTDGKAGDYKVVKIQPVKKGGSIVGYQVQVKGMNHYSDNEKWIFDKK